MADVFAVFGTLLALGIAFPGMLTTWWLFFPRTVQGARLRVSKTPGRCLVFGGVVTFMLALPIAVLLALPGGIGQLLGVIAIIALLGYGSLGAAGMAAELGIRLQDRSQSGLSASGAFVRGAVLLELAAIFPVIGWFIFIPLAVIASIGASTFALLRWTPGIPAAIQPEVSASRA